jgi:hypothetical protein
MKAAYRDYLNTWKAAGGGLFMHFVHTGQFTKHGRWGAQEYMAQPLAATPKLQAIYEFMANNRLPVTPGG